MSDLLFNIRFGTRHLQIGPETFSFKVNTYHVRNKPVRWFKIYCAFGNHYI